MRRSGLKIMLGHLCAIAITVLAADLLMDCCTMAFSLPSCGSSGLLYLSGR